MTRNVGNAPTGDAPVAGAQTLVAPDDVAVVESVDASLEHAESPEAKSHRISMGVLLAVIGVLLLVLATRTHGTARFALSGALDAVQLPTFPLPGAATIVVGAILCLLSAAALFAHAPAKLRVWLNVLAGIGVVVGFATWMAAAGTNHLPFPLSNQLNGTMLYATPLILGALAGVMGENAGVVNVAIEGQFLTGAFAAALVGTITHSIVIAVIAGMLVGMLMGVLLALFSIKYLVDQVVLGVVLNLFATGLTGFLYSLFMSTNQAAYNQAPTMKALAIPGLSKIPFIGPIVFEQTFLAYLALVCILIVWFLLNRTKWGLRVRAVGEHPEAAETVGINVRAIRWQAVLVGGLLAGLGGTFFTIGSTVATGQFNKGMTVGNGFIALAALIMGRWKPGLAALMALLFGFVQSLGNQGGTLGVPMDSNILGALPYIVTVIAVAGFIGRVVAPKADGINYTK
jgi:simple sugar transport system permease protein